MGSVITPLTEDDEKDSTSETAETKQKGGCLLGTKEPHLNLSLVTTRRSATVIADQNLLSPKIRKGIWQGGDNEEGVERQSLILLAVCRGGSLLLLQKELKKRKVKGRSLGQVLLIIKSR